MAPALGQVISLYPVPTANSAPFYIAAGPDGALWFTENSAGKIGRITTAGVVTEFAIPTANSNPEGIAAGPDGALWFCEASKIGRITTTGTITEFNHPNDSCGGMTVGPDGALWFAAALGIGRITTTGALSEFAIPNFHTATDIAAGPDGALWFTETLDNRIGRITTTGVITEFIMPRANSGPWGIASGPDGALWFAEWETGGNKIGRISMGGVITEFAVPTAGTLLGITAGPDGALWFTENQKIGRITTAGVVTEFGPSTGIIYPNFIASGPDGALWFTDTFSRIGRITTSGGGGGPSLTVSKAVASSVASGQNLTYTITYGNTGAGNATGVQINDTLPAGTTFVSATGGGTASAGVVSWNIGTLNAGVTGQTVSFTVNVTAASGTITNSAYSIQATGVSAITGSSVSTAVTAAGAPALTVSKSAPSTIVSGQSLTYTITYGNTGTANAAGVMVSDTLPAGTNFVSGTGNVAFASGIVTWNIGTLNAGVTGQTVSFTVTVTAGSGTITNGTYSIQATGVSPVAGSPVSTTVTAAGESAETVVVVVSSPGALGALFKTGFQMHNSTASPLSGRLIFHRQGTSGSGADPSLSYSLAPGQTQSFDDLLPTMGLTGPQIGSLDVVAQAGAALPIVAARVFNEGGAAGTTGFTMGAASPDSILGTGDHGVLFTPADIGRFRMNIGVRSGPLGAAIVVTRRNAAGVVVQVLTKNYAPNFFEQIGANDFLSGSPYAANDSITIQVTSGSAIVYAVNADNTTQDPSVQFATKAP